MQLDFAGGPGGCASAESCAAGEGQRNGAFRDSITPNFAAMAFYGAIEQVLTGWIFGTLDQDDDAYERAKGYVVETICDGLEA